MNAGNALPTVGERLVFRHDALRKARGAILAGKQSHDLFDLEGVDGDGNKIIGRFHLAPLIDTISSLDARIGGVTFIGCKSRSLSACGNEIDCHRCSTLIPPPNLTKPTSPSRWLQKLRYGLHETRRTDCVYQRWRLKRHRDSSEFLAFVGTTYPFGVDIETSCTSQNRFSYIAVSRTSVTYRSTSVHLRAPSG